MKVEIRPARVGHALLMAKRCPEVQRLGRAYLCQVFRTSTWRRALFIDGRCVGLGGVTGALMGPRGQVWLVLAPEALRHPRVLLREGRRTLNELLGRHGALATLIMAGDDAAARFARHLGFRIWPGPSQFGPYSYHYAMIGTE